MTKRVPIRSIEEATRRALSVLGDEGVESAIENGLGLQRSASLIRKCADADNDRHHLQLRYAIALDHACVDRGFAPPYLSLQQFLVSERMSDVSVARGGTDMIVRRLLGLQAALGEIASILLRADRGGDAGEAALDDGTRAELCRMLEDLAGAALRAERMVAASGRMSAGAMSAPVRKQGAR